MWGEILEISKVVHGQPHGESSRPSRTLSMGTDPNNGDDECQQFQTNLGSLVSDLVLPFQLNCGVSRCLAATAKQKSMIDPVDGQPPTDPVDGQTHTHGYNTRSKIKAENVMQGDDLQEKPSRVASKKIERNAGGLSHTPVGYTIRNNLMAQTLIQYYRKSTTEILLE